MSSIAFENLKGMQVISFDARLLGTVLDVGYDQSSWRGTHMRIALSKGIEKELAVGKGRHSAKTLIPVSAIANLYDVVLVDHEISYMKDIISPDTNSSPLLSSLIGKKVLSSDNLSVGTIIDVLIDPADNWSVPNLSVVVDKETVEPLGLKKSLLGRLPVIPVNTLNIKMVGDMVFLAISLEELKGSVSLYD
ncbi:MAG: hypothetical protein PWQ62_747 [Candidatus Methanomethylophilaceae archaeon]|nr:hypothetical protein [Candidatus Methanomethylophilaceae archaeon]